MSNASANTPEVAAVPKRSRGRRPIVLGLVLLLVGAACGWWFYMRPAETEKPPIPGEVVSLEPVQLNLAGGRYLRVGVALEIVEGAEEVDGSKALDAVIELFSGRSIDEIGDDDRRAVLKKQLIEELQARYHGDVITAYFTDFVTQ